MCGGGKKAKCMADGDILKIRKYPFLPADSEQGWLPYMWLVYLFIFLVPVVLSPDFRVWWLTAGTIAVFLPLYFRGYWEHGWRQFALSAAMCVLVGSMIDKGQGEAAVRKNRSWRVGLCWVTKAVVRVLPNHRL